MTAHPPTLRPRVPACPSRHTRVARSTDGCGSPTVLSGSAAVSWPDRGSRMGRVCHDPRSAGHVCPDPQTTAAGPRGAWATTPAVRGMCAPTPKRPPPTRPLLAAAATCHVLNVTSITRWHLDGWGIWAERGSTGLPGRYHHPLPTSAALQQLPELLNGEARIPEDVPQRARTDVTTRVDGNRGPPAIRMTHDVVAAVDPADDESRLSSAPTTWLPRTAGTGGIRQRRGR
jgi:hypothetical protein